jgi:hypothetical protein
MGREDVQKMLIRKIMNRSSILTVIWSALRTQLLLCVNICCTLKTCRIRTSLEIEQRKKVLERNTFKKSLAIVIIEIQLILRPSQLSNFRALRELVFFDKIFAMTLLMHME